MDIKKNKPADTALSAWLEPLIGPLYLDFVAPFPLEESLRRIKAEEQLGFFRYRKVRVDLIPHDADTFGFTVTKSGNKYARTEARGYLKRWDKHTTLVTGQVNVALINYVILVPITLLMLLFFFALWREAGWFGFAFVAIMILNWYAMRRNRHEVARLIETALDADDRDDPDAPIQWNA